MKTENEFAIFMIHGDGTLTILGSIEKDSTFFSTHNAAIHYLKDEKTSERNPEGYFIVLPVIAKSL